MSFAEPINVATWNIRINVREDSLAGNIWSNRREAIVKMVRLNDFDIWGVQEDFNRELNELNLKLPYFLRKGYPNHENGMVGTFNSVFYKKDFWICQLSCIAFLSLFMAIQLIDNIKLYYSSTIIIFIMYSIYTYQALNKRLEINSIIKKYTKK
jgi:hypothetical protein